MKNNPRRPLAALFAMLLLLAACGDSTETTDAQATDSGSSDSASSDGDDHGHGHGEAIEVPDGMAVPQIDISATVDPKAGHNVMIELSDFTIAPENASTEPIDGEGHLHLYVDGERVMRFYNQAIHLDGLEPGDHQVMVEVSANNHSSYAVDGEPIQAMTTITVADDGADAGDGHDHGDVFEATTPPAIELAVTKDPKSGWNVFADVSNLVFAPESSGLDPVDGEGHLHLYVDDTRVARLYGPWWHIPALEAGSHEIRVEAATNDHASYGDGSGQPVSAVATIEVDEADAAMADQAMADGDSDGEETGHDHGDGHSHEGTGELLAIPAADADVVVNAGFLDGSVEVEDRRVRVETGQTVGITFESDTVEQIHVHGYDLLIDVGPDKTADIAFLADSPGTFEVELESSGRFLFEVQVS